MMMSVLVKPGSAFLAMSPQKRRLASDAINRGRMQRQFASSVSNEDSTKVSKTEAANEAESSSAAAPPLSINSNAKRLFPEELNILYDSKCNVCKLEMEWLAKRDVRINTGDNKMQHPKLKLTDLEGAAFDPKDPANGGIDYETGMAAIYAVTADGKVLTGVPAFALAYDKVGLGWLWGIYNVPGVKLVFNWGYDVFAKYRTRLTRGSSLEELVELHLQKQRQLEEQDDCESCRKL